MRDRRSRAKRAGGVGVTCLALVGAGCAGPPVVIAPPAWQSGAKLDPSASATLRLRPSPKARYRTCFLIRMKVDDIDSDDPELTRKVAVDAVMGFSTFEEVDASTSEIIELRSWGGMMRLGLVATGLVDGPFKAGDTDRTIVGGVVPYKVSTRNRRLVPARTERVDDARSPDHWDIDIKADYPRISEFPRAPLAPGSRWSDPKRAVTVNGDRSLRVEMAIDQTRTFLGVEHAAEGDAWLMTVDGTFEQTTRSELIDGVARGRVAGGTRLSARDGIAGKTWYAMVGRLAVGPAEGQPKGGGFDARVDLRLESETVPSGPDEAFPLVDGGELPSDPCAAWAERAIRR